MKIAVQDLRTMMCQVWRKVSFLGRVKFSSPRGRNFMAGQWGHVLGDGCTAPKSGNPLSSQQLSTGTRARRDLTCRMRLAQLDRYVGWHLGWSAVCWSLSGFHSLKTGSSASFTHLGCHDQGKKKKDEMHLTHALSASTRKMGKSKFLGVLAFDGNSW